MTRPGTSAIVAAIAASFFSVTFVYSTPVHADLSGKQIIERCQKAYASLKNYQGTTTIVGGIRGGATQYVVFERLGRIRIEDTHQEWTFGPSSRKTSAGLELIRSSKARSDGQIRPVGNNDLDFSYRSVTSTYVSDGAHNWVTMYGEAMRELPPGETDKTEKPFKFRPGGASKTSIAGLLIGLRQFKDLIGRDSSRLVWDGPFTNVIVDSVSREILHGRAVYKVVTTCKVGNEPLKAYVVYWIDQETFLLAMYSAPGILETYSNISTNKPIPDTIFTPIPAPLSIPDPQPLAGPQPKVHLVGGK